MRMLVLLPGVLLLAACGSPGPVADGANNITDIDVLPADESVATPTSDLANGVAPPVNGASTPQTAIPAALHGRWGLVPADCTGPASEAKGLVTINADQIRFYESVARPAEIVERSDRRIRGEFAFTGEGMSWSGPMIWSVEGNRLTRIDSEGDSRLVYTRC